MARDTELLIRQRLRELDQDPDNALQRVLIDVTEQIAVAMEAKGVTRKELADRMGVKPPMITRLLNGPENTTLRTLMRVAYALDMIIDVNLGKPEVLEAREEEAIRAGSPRDARSASCSGVGLQAGAALRRASSRS